jgi:hypothetical protein
MPNDAKFGLVCGVGLVIAVAVVFFRREAPLIALPSGPAAIGKPANEPNPPPPPPQRQPIIARPTGSSSDEPFLPQLPEAQASSEGDAIFHPTARTESAPPIGLLQPGGQAPTNTQPAPR